MIRKEPSLLNHGPWEKSECKHKHPGTWIFLLWYLTLSFCYLKFLNYNIFQDFWNYNIVASFLFFLQTFHATSTLCSLLIHGLFFFVVSHKLWRDGKRNCPSSSALRALRCLSSSGKCVCQQGERWLTRSQSACRRCWGGVYQHWRSYFRGAVWGWWEQVLFLGILVLRFSSNSHSVPILPTFCLWEWSGIERGRDTKTLAYPWKSSLFSFCQSCVSLAGLTLVHPVPVTSRHHRVAVSDVS